MAEAFSNSFSKSNPSNSNSAKQISITSVVKDPQESSFSMLRRLTQ